MSMSINGFVKSSYNRASKNQNHNKKSDFVLLPFKKTIKPFVEKKQRILIL